MTGSKEALPGLMSLVDISRSHLIEDVDKKFLLSSVRLSHSELS